jgi:predicted NAD/FAD-binding protein
VVATHANDALALLTDASQEERAALSRFRYSTNEAVLHTDSSAMPANNAAWASWNYLSTDCRAERGSLGMTYHLNRLQALHEPMDYFVSLNAATTRPEMVIDEMSYEHPTYTFETLTAQRDIEALQGQRRTYFAGAHLGYGFHEDGLQSGVRVARRLGIEL